LPSLEPAHDLSEPYPRIQDARCRFEKVSSQRREQIGVRGILEEESQASDTLARVGLQLDADTGEVDTRQWGLHVFC
jgi:hypothetical protein